jgi:phospholipid/cholesterol/gamma-HCH transport system ATP-binding protein
MSANHPVLRFEHVNLHFGDTPALVDLSFEIGPGETRVILGAAGSGKTTLLKTAVGLVKADSGKVFLFGEDISDRKESEMFGIRSQVGILFQEGGLFDSLTIAENVAYPLLNQQAAAGQPRHQALKEEDPEVERRVHESLRFVELEHTVDKFPSELSGGMRRRVGIARAIVTEPALVLYDSPTAGLDPITANTIIALLIKERDLRNAAAIMVTHRFLDGHLMANFRYNPNSGEIERADTGTAQNGHGSEQAAQASTKFLVMKEGQLVFEGSEAELLASKDPYIQKFQRAGSS